MFDYGKLQKVAQGIFKTFAQGDIRLSVITPGNGPAYNPGASVESTPITVDATASGVMQKYVDNGLAVATDKQINMAYDPAIQPDVEGQAYIDGTPYKIVQVIRVPEAGTTIAYHIIARG